MSLSPLPQKTRFALWTSVLAIVALLCVYRLAGNGLAESKEALAHESGPQAALPQVEMRIGKQAYVLEKTVTPEQAQTGLMYRTALPPFHGMLFSFEPPRVVSFWMKNTLIPLDMLFLRNGKVVYIEPSVPPCQSEPCPTYGPDQVVDMVVELPAGTVQTQGILPGSLATFFIAMQPQMPPASGK